MASDKRNRQRVNRAALNDASSPEPSADGFWASLADLDPELLFDAIRSRLGDGRLRLRDGAPVLDGQPVLVTDEQRALFARAWVHLPVHLRPADDLRFDVRKSAGRTL